MLKLNNRIIYILMLALLIFTGYLINYFRTHENAIACEANLRILDKDNIINFHMNISLDNGDGFITISGHDSVSDSILRIRKTFNYLTKKNSVMVMYNDGSVINYSNSELLNFFNKYLPAFFFSIQPEQKMLTRVIRGKNDTLVFMIVDTPLFVCEAKR